MKITFHGVRGSVPVSGPKFSKYGGHTSCLEVCTQDVQLIIDAGSGFQNVKLLEDRPLLLVLAISTMTTYRDWRSIQTS